MTAPVIIDGQAAIFDQETGEVVRCSVPTAMENVANGKGRFVHGDKGDLLTGTAVQALAAPEPVIALREEGVLDLPAADQPEIEAAPAPVVDDLADTRTTPGDSPEKLEAIEREVDEANGKLTTAQNAALDHDGDAKAGGSTPKAGRSAEEEAERAALFKFFKDLDVKVFAGSTTDKLRAKKAEIEAATAP